MKNILKRIIVGIIIGLVLMCVRQYLFVNANALETTIMNVDGMSFCQTDNSCAGVNMSNYGIGDLGITFKGFNAGAFDRSYISWNVPGRSFNSNVDIHFSIITSNVISYDTEPFKVVFHDWAGSLFTCDIDSSNHYTVYSIDGVYHSYLDNGVSYVNPVVCRNIPLSSLGYQVVLLSNFRTSGGIVAISPLTVYDHSSTSAVTGAINNASSSVTNSVNDLNDSINDDTISSDTDNNISDLQNTDISSTDDAGIQDLITLPIELFNGILSSLNGSCSPYRIGSLLGEDIILPCFNLGGVLGSVWNIIDIVISSCIFFKFATKLKEIFINLTSLNENKGDLIE